MDNYENPIPGKTYISPGLKAFGQADRTVRIASKVIQSSDAYAFGTIKDERIIRGGEGSPTKIKATFFEDDRRISVLNIQRYTTATDKPQNASFSFIGTEINTLLEFIANIQTVDKDGLSSPRISDDELRNLALNKSQMQILVNGNEEVIAEVVRSSITKMDVVAVAYRKNQLSMFRRLLDSSELFNRAKAKIGAKTDEAVWQKFFEKNPWIFGYGLNYIFHDALDGKKLEQVVQGSRIGLPGKRVDALLQSKGAVSSLCFVEIKRHDTQLLSTKKYRAGCWPQSSELAGAITQSQVTVATAMDNIRDSLRLEDENGDLTGEEIFNYAPKSYVVIGNLSEFEGEKGVHRAKLRSFELIRRSLHNPEIITFDELYERARFIVSQSDAAP